MCVYKYIKRHIFAQKHTHTLAQKHTHRRTETHTHTHMYTHAQQLRLLELKSKRPRSSNLTELEVTLGKKVTAVIVDNTASTGNMQVTLILHFIDYLTRNARR